MNKLGVAETAINGCLGMFYGGMLFLSLLAAPGTSRAASVLLEWDPSTDADLAGYRVYYQANSHAIPFQGTDALEGNAPVEGGNSTTATISGLDPGTSYYFAVTAYNSAGLESVYSNIVEIKESVAPSISIAAPAANSSVNGTVSVSATATDNVGVARVRFFLDGAPAMETAASPYLFSLDISALTPGMHFVSAKAFDASGNEGTSNEVTFAVAGDTVMPTVSLVVPPADTRVSGTINVSASASDNNKVVQLEMYVDGTLVLTGNQSPVAYRWDTTLLSDGNHLLAARAYDAAGNIGSSSASILVGNAVGPTAPPAITEPVTLTDARLALQIASGKLTPTTTELQRLDLAPWVNGTSHPNGRVDTGDVVVILSKLIGKL